jgi:hypothetical protein
MKIVAVLHLIQQLNENGNRQLDYHQNFDDVAQE